MHGVPDLVPVSQCLCILLLFISAGKGATMFMVTLAPNAEH